MNNLSWNKLAIYFGATFCGTFCAALGAIPLDAALGARQWLLVVVGAIGSGLVTVKAYLSPGPSPDDSAARPPAPKTGGSMPLTTGALAIACMCFAALMLTTGCVTSGMQYVQGVNDKIAASYGQTDSLQAGREALAEVEAAKTGRVLLPRGATAIPGQYVDDFGTPLTNGVTLDQWYRVQRRIAERQIVAPSPAVAPTPTPALPPAGPSQPTAGDLLAVPVNSTVTP